MIEVFFGAPYVPVLKGQIEPLLDAIDLKPGQTLVDLGCGDGRILKSAAKRGISGVGYEINPLLYLVARINCCSVRPKVQIKLANYWKIKLPKADGIFVFLIGHYMPKLDRFMTGQDNRPAKVLSYVYPIPGKKPAVEGKNYFVYRY